MYQLFYRTPDLLLLPYPLLLIKRMTYSLAIRFFSQSLVMKYRALNKTPHRRYLTKFWNFWYGLLVKRKENYFYLWKCNNIKNNTQKRDITACLKLQVPKIKHDYQIHKKGLISKFKMTSDIFLIRGIFRILKYSNVGRYLGPCQTYRKFCRKNFQDIIFFAGRSFLDHF